MFNQASHGLFPGGFGNFYSVFGSGSDPFNQGGGKTPPIPQPPKPKGNTEVQVRDIGKVCR